MRRDLQSAFAGLAILGVALGIGRFALTPLLPLMQVDAGLSLLAGGWLASMNNLGYLVGAMLCTALALPQRNTLRTALVLSGPDTGEAAEDGPQPVATADTLAELVGVSAS